MKRSVSLSVVACLASLLAGSAHADNLLVLSAAAARKALAPVPAWVQTSTGDRVSFIFGTAGEMRKKALSGAPFDIVIVPPTPLADLVKKGAVVAGSREDLGVVRLAAAVRLGAPSPDISTVSALKATLLRAPSIGIANPATGATSGIYLAKLMQKLGIADAVQAKLRYFPDGSLAMEAAARGEIAIGLGQKSEITPVPGVRLVGLLPATVQLNTIYSAGLASRDAHKKSARALLAFLASPKAQDSFRRNGFDPVR